MSDYYTCQRCDGSGLVTVMLEDDHGEPTEPTERDCPDCDATGLRSGRDEEGVYWERVAAWLERDR